VPLSLARLVISKRIIWDFSEADFNESRFYALYSSVLLERLSSWFGISGTALNWAKSYLTSRSFYIQVRDSLSSVYQFLYGVPQGSVLGPLLFILYIIPLSTIISKSSVHRHLYADDTQHFMSFSSNKFLENVSLLESAIPEVSSWILQIFLCSILLKLKLNSYL
jgi:Reverse transcriptase (RNA-dependent DNA polymerase)